MNIQTLRPGLLVAMNTSLRGNTSYQVEEIEGTHVTEEGALRARWETTRTVTDPEEHERATKLRTKVRGLILSVCSISAFGLLCPESKHEELTAAITEARRLVDEFNCGASLTRVQFNVIYGRIAQDDVEAIKAITAELRQLMDDMQEGLVALDVTRVRAACNKAKAVGEMLSDDAQSRLQVAIDASRQAARKIVKAGEAVVGEIDRSAISKIDMARTSFLDFDMSALDVVEPAADARAVEMMEV